MKLPAHLRPKSRPHCGRLASETRLRAQCGQMYQVKAGAVTPGLYPAFRRRKLHIPRFHPKRRKLAHSAAPPFPTGPTSLGSGGSPGKSSAEPQKRPKTARNSREGLGPCWVPSRSTQGLTGAHGLILVILRLVDTLPHHLLRWISCLHDAPQWEAQAAAGCSSGCCSGATYHSLHTVKS